MLKYLFVVFCLHLSVDPRFSPNINLPDVLDFSSGISQLKEMLIWIWISSTKPLFVQNNFLFPTLSQNVAKYLEAIFAVRDNFIQISPQSHKKDVYLFISASSWF